MNATCMATCEIRRFSPFLSPLRFIDNAMGCGSSSDRDMDEDVTKGERLDAPDAVKNAPQKPSNKKQQEKYVGGKRTIDLSGTILEKPGDVRDYYTFDKVLGKGSFGVVHLVQEITTKLPFAC